jgi:hypothetical protein
MAWPHSSVQPEHLLGALWGFAVSERHALMPWVKLDDQFTDHPKVLACGPLASWLYVCGLAYCARLLTDGFIPEGQVRKLADVDDAKALANQLVAVNLWERCDGGYRVHDYHDYQPTREKALAIREARAEAGSRGGKQKASNLLERGQASATNNVVAKSYPVPVPVPVPIQNPSDAHPQESEGADAPAPRAKKKITVETFGPTDDLWEWAEQSFPNVDAYLETDRFLDWCRANGKTFKDWGAAWKNWIRRSAEMMPRHPPATPNGIAHLTPNNRQSVAAIMNFDPTRRHR